MKRACINLLSTKEMTNSEQHVTVKKYKFRHMKNIKHIIALFIITLVSIGMNTNAQSSDKREQLKSLKIGFITEALDLSPNEASDFWPIYNYHQDNIHKLSRQNRSIRYELKPDNFEAMSDSKATELLNRLLKTDKEIYTEKEAMFDKLKSVLPSKKIIKLHKAENEFNRKMLEHYRKRKESQKK